MLLTLDNGVMGSRLTGCRLLFQPILCIRTVRCEMRIMKVYCGMNSGMWDGMKNCGANSGMWDYEGLWCTALHNSHPTSHCSDATKILFKGK